MNIDFLLRFWLQEDFLKIDNWQYINCINLWVRFICVNYKDCNNVHSLFSSVVQIIRGVAHLLPGMRYLPLRLKLAQMLNELSNCNQMFFPVPSLIFGCLEFRETFQKEQTEKINTHFSSLLKVLHFAWNILLSYSCLYEVTEITTIILFLKKKPIVIVLNCYLECILYGHPFQMD